MSVDLAHVPCPTRVLDGITAPLSVEFSAAQPGVVRISITATSPVVLGVRQVPAVPTSIALPNGAPVPTVNELDVRWVPVERVVVEIPAEFAAGDVTKSLAAAIAAASTSQNGDHR